MKPLAELKDRLSEVEAIQRDVDRERFEILNRERFEILAEIEKLENPESYAKNKNYWESYENRFNNAFKLK